MDRRLLRARAACRLVVLDLPRRGADAQPRDKVSSLPRRLIAKWILLAAVPSGLILSTTLYLTTDLVAVPLLWVIPLGAYLLSFTVAFASRRWPADANPPHGTLHPAVERRDPLRGHVGTHPDFAALAVLNLFTLSVALHSQLFDSRPEPSRLTAFYLMMSVGGVLGGVFCALVAPQLFDWTYEHLLLMLAAAALMEDRHFVAALAAAVGQR